MNLCRLALALGAAVPFAAHASDQAPLMRRYPGYPPGDYGYQPQARQGLLLSIGLGGGPLHLSNVSPTRNGAGDIDLRRGYGLSDPFPLLTAFIPHEGSTDH